MYTTSCIHYAAHSQAGKSRLHASLYSTKPIQHDSVLYYYRTLDFMEWLTSWKQLYCGSEETLLRLNISTQIRYIWIYIWIYIYIYMHILYRYIMLYVIICSCNGTAVCRYISGVYTNIKLYNVRKITMIKSSYLQTNLDRTVVPSSINIHVKLQQPTQYYNI